MGIKFAIVGATGVGKTALSIDFALQNNAEIICVDSRQIYKHFCIGTAQPTKEELAKVPHHLVHFLEPTEKFSAGAFLKNVHQILKENQRKNFILVGGTGLYLKSLIEGLPDIPEISEATKEKVDYELKTLGLTYAYTKAYELDPAATKKVSPTDARRLGRILEVFYETNTPLSEFQKNRKSGIGEIPVYFINRTRDALYKRINARVDSMIQNGWVEEVEMLAKTVDSNAPAWNSLGYLDILNMLQGKISKENAIEKIKQETRRFAKRQLTWFRHQIQSTEKLLES